MKTNLKTELITVAYLGLAKRKMKELKDIEEALAAELGVEDDGTGYYGHVSDAVFSGNDTNAKQLIKKINKS